MGRKAATWEAWTRSSTGEPGPSLSVCTEAQMSVLWCCVVLSQGEFARHRQVQLYLLL